MNLGMFRRAIDRHRYMQDAPAYREFLEEVRAHGDTWCVPQAEVADWWERRQNARLTVDAQGGVHVDLEGAVIEVDGTETRIPPFSLSADEYASSLPTIPAGMRNLWTKEVLGHLGYGHLLADPESVTNFDSERFGTLMNGLHDSARLHQRLDESALDELRAVLRELHHAHGFPDLRIWPLPQRDGRPYRVAVSTRYDVDKAIVTLPYIHAMEEEFGLRSTVYLRPMGVFYGKREIRRYAARRGGHEIALHGEFVTTAQERWETEERAAVGEKDLLAELTGAEIAGVCMHGGELRTNTTPRTRDVIESAGYRYETMYRNSYYLPLHLPHGDGVRRTLSIGQHFADITVPGGAGFSEALRDAFLDRFAAAARSAGVFVPVMHPLYFGLGHYLRYPENVWRILAFMPVFVMRAIKMKSGQAYANRPD